MRPVPDIPTKGTLRDPGLLMPKDNPQRMSHLNLNLSPKWLALTLQSHARAHILRIQNIPTLQSLRRAQAPPMFRILPGLAFLQMDQRVLHTHTTRALVTPTRKNLMAIIEDLVLPMSKRQGMRLDMSPLRIRGMGMPLPKPLLCHLPMYHPTKGMVHQRILNMFPVILISGPRLAIHVLPVRIPPTVSLLRVGTPRLILCQPRRLYPCRALRRRRHLRRSITSHDRMDNHPAMHRI